jgi:hypothetical protein
MFKTMKIFPTVMPCADSTMNLQMAIANDEFIPNTQFNTFVSLLDYIINSLQIHKECYCVPMELGLSPTALADTLKQLAINLKRKHVAFYKQYRNYWDESKDDDCRSVCSGDTIAEELDAEQRELVVKTKSLLVDTSRDLVLFGKNVGKLVCLGNHYDYVRSTITDSEIEGLLRCTKVFRLSCTRTSLIIDTCVLIINMGPIVMETCYQGVDSMRDIRVSRMHQLPKNCAQLAHASSLHSTRSNEAARTP